MTLKELYEIFKKSSGICTDTRQLVPGNIFFALKGENFDGNRFVKEALSKACFLAVCNDPKWKGNRKVHVVDSALEVLQSLANYHRKQKNVTVLAITGSNGKTTTKELIAKVLSSEFKILYTEGNLNNHIGVPLTLLRLEDEKIAVIEMGANHADEIALLCNIAEPDLGIITNIGKAHLEGFGSVEGVRKAKGELFDYLALDKKMILFNCDDTRLVDMAKIRGLEGLCYGVENEGDVKGTILDARPYLRGEIEIAGASYPISTRMAGRYNFLNILAAISAGLYFKIKPERIIESLSQYAPENNRSQLIKGKTNTLLLDAYNANPTSMKLALEDFIREQGEKTMVILGEMLELGDESEKEHKIILNYLKDSGVNEVILVGSHFLHFSDKEYPFHFFADIHECILYLKDNMPTGFRILLKGSRKNTLEEASNLLSNS